MKDQLLNEIQDVFREVFDKPGLSLTLQTTARDVTGWDSLTHMRLVAALENYFNIIFTFDEVSLLQNVGDIVHLIEKKSGR
jgi:acyl carrier protein